MKLESKITTISILVGIIGIVSSSYIYLNSSNTATTNFTLINSSSTLASSNSQNSSYSVSPAYKTSSNLSHATLLISASGADITIKESKSGTLYPGGKVSSAGVDQIIYLPKGQSLSINLTGAGTDLNISSHIADQIAVNNSGAGSNVAVF